MPEPAAPPRDNRRGIAAMVAGLACFFANDALVKTVSAELNTGQIVLPRGAGAVSGD